jgi:hypothetical protein
VASASRPISPLATDDRRGLAHGLVSYWFGRWGMTDQRNDLDIDAVELQKWFGNLAVLDVVDHGADFRCRLLGTRLVHLFASDWTSKCLSSLPHRYREDLRRVCVPATLDQSPKGMDRCWRSNDGHSWDCAIRALPIAGDELTATRLLLGIFYGPHDAPRLRLPAGAYLPPHSHLPH